MLGHSYGAIACMLAAAQRPEAVRSLALVEPPAFGLVRGDPAVEAMVERLNAHIARGADMTEEEYLRGFLNAWGFDLGPGPTLNRVARRSVRRSIGERTPLDARSRSPSSHAAPFPILVARGGWDAVPPAAYDDRRAGVHRRLRPAGRAARAPSRPSSPARRTSRSSSASRSTAASRSSGSAEQMPAFRADC